MLIGGQLFTLDFLNEGIRQTPDYRQLQAADIALVRAAIMSEFKDLSPETRREEAHTEDSLIFPVIQRLGFAHQDAGGTTPLYHRQVAPAEKGRKSIPDMLLFASKEDRQQADRMAEGRERNRFGLAIVENKQWMRSLDQRGKGGNKDEAPYTQMLRYLDRVALDTDRRIQWGILTNGRHWRLYFNGARNRIEDYLELDLPALLGLSPFADTLFTFPNDEELEAYQLHWFKVFLLLFRREAFIKGADDRTFHERALDAGREWQDKVKDSIAEKVFRDVYPSLIRNLIENDPAADPTSAAYRGQARHAALILLYRLLFLFYAEDRGLLPVKDRRYDDYSLKLMRQRVGDRMRQHDVFSTARNNIWAHLNNLFTGIAIGDSDLGLPPYNGGLFHQESDSVLARS